MTDVASGLVDHVNEDPSQVHRTTTERCDGRDAVERVTITYRRLCGALRRSHVDDLQGSVGSSGE